MSGKGFSSDDELNRLSARVKAMETALKEVQSNGQAYAALSLAFSQIGKMILLANDATDVDIAYSLQTALSTLQRKWADRINATSSNEPLDPALWETTKTMIRRTFNEQAAMEGRAGVLASLSIMDELWIAIKEAPGVIGKAVGEAARTVGEAAGSAAAGAASGLGFGGTALVLLVVAVVAFVKFKA